MHKVRGIDATPHQLEQLTRMHEEDAFSVPRLLQSPLFRALLMDAIVRLESPQSPIKGEAEASMAGLSTPTLTTSSNPLRALVSRDTVHP